MPNFVRPKIGHVWRIASRNVFRQPAQSLIPLGAISVGVAALIVVGGFMRDGLTRLSQAVRCSMGDIQIAKNGFFEHGASRPERYLMQQPELAELRNRLGHVTEVREVTVRMSRFSGLLLSGGGGMAVTGEGLEPKEQLHPCLMLSAGRGLAESHPYGALVDEGVANNLKVKLGNQLSLIAYAYDAMNMIPLEVIGIFQSASKDYDSRAIQITLPAGQELLDTRGANLAVLWLDTNNEEDVVRKITYLLARPDLEIRTWKQLSHLYADAVRLHELRLNFLRAVVLIMVLVSVANSINARALARAGEFRTMRVLGDDRRRVFAIVLTESALLGFVGSLLGVLLGVGLALSLSAVGIPMPALTSSHGYVAQIAIVPTVAITAFSTGCLAALIAGVLPALRVARLPIIDKRQTKV